MSFVELLNAEPKVDTLPLQSIYYRLDALPNDVTTGVKIQAAQLLEDLKNKLSAKHHLLKSTTEAVYYAFGFNATFQKQCVKVLTALAQLRLSIGVVSKMYSDQEFEYLTSKKCTVEKAVWYFCLTYYPNRIPLVGDVVNARIEESLLSCPDENSPLYVLRAESSNVVAPSKYDEVMTAIQSLSFTGLSFTELLHVSRALGGKKATCTALRNNFRPKAV